MDLQTKCLKKFKYMKYIQNLTKTDLTERREISAKRAVARTYCAPKNYQGVYSAKSVQNATILVLKPDTDL